MKQITLAALLFLSLGGQAQTLHYDSVMQQTYVRIQPVTWMRNKPAVSRLYIHVGNDNLTSTATAFWELRDSVYIDPTTNNYNLIDNGNYPVAGMDYQGYFTDSRYLFTLICDTSHLNLTIK